MSQQYNLYKRTFSLFVTKREALLVWTVALLMLTLFNLTPTIPAYDTPFYFAAGDNWAHGKIDCLRTPVYPLLLHSALHIANGDMLMGGGIYLYFTEPFLFAFIDCFCFHCISDGALKSVANRSDVDLCSDDSPWMV